jgi:hypothetical protein
LLPFYCHVSVDTTGPALFGTEEINTENVEMDEGEWADFQSTDTVVQSDLISDQVSCPFRRRQIILNRDRCLLKICKLWIRWLQWKRCSFTALCYSDSSQFTSSEQSENEDFKVLESYLDDFSKKKQQMEKQESPLHRPISKTTNLPQSAYSMNVNPIPAIKSLWPKHDSKKVTTATPVVITESSKTTTFSLQSSDSEFADFQQAPVPIQPTLLHPFLHFLY